MRACSINGARRRVVRWCLRIGLLQILGQLPELPEHYRELARDPRRVGHFKNSRVRMADYRARTVGIIYKGLYLGGVRARERAGVRIPGELDPAPMGHDRFELQLTAHSCIAIPQRG